MKKKKSFGQHFLKDETLCERIVDAARIERGDLVVEIGPGQGALTNYLPQERSILVELDRELIDDLRGRYPLATVIRDDAASIDFDHLAGDRPWVLIGNLPYNAANAIMMNALRTNGGLRRLIVMVQKEVADRMLAPPGPNRGVLSVAVQLHGDVSRVMDVRPGSFVPPPNVMSSVVRLDINPRADDPEALMVMVSAGFSSRRKQLHKNLATAGFATSDQVKQSLRSVGIREDIRAQDLSVDNWIALQGCLMAR